ncbi:MAG: hypothetical protein Q8K60_01745 [Parachlamydiaceae bacterium]|nr:hypothetical protein [Parachlamydiaceae bacterium]
MYTIFNYIEPIELANVYNRLPYDFNYEPFFTLATALKELKKSPEEILTIYNSCNRRVNVFIQIFHNFPQTDLHAIASTIKEFDYSMLNKLNTIFDIKDALNLSKTFEEIITITKACKFHPYKFVDIYTRLPHIDPLELAMMIGEVILNHSLDELIKKIDLENGKNKSLEDVKAPFNGINQQSPLKHKYQGHRIISMENDLSGRLYSPRIKIPLLKKSNPPSLQMLKIFSPQG